MTGRPSLRWSAVAVALAAATAGCQPAVGPRRVPADGAPCSAVMPDTPPRQEGTLRLGAVAVTERAWELRMPDAGVDAPRDRATYVVRRAAVPAGSGLRDAALLDAASARVVRGIELGTGDGTKATVATVAADGGDAVELRWPSGGLHNATRLLLIPGGYCEATILGARTEAEITSYFASVRARPAGTN